MLQNNVTITFKSDVKLEAIEDDRFMVCCLEDRDACSQVTWMIREEDRVSKVSVQVPYGQGWMGVDITGQPDSKSVSLDVSKSCQPM